MKRLIFLGLALSGMVNSLTASAQTNENQNPDFAQKQMHRVRQEAAAMGINIAPSKWETMTISM